MAEWTRKENTKGLRVIKTARDKDSINRAALKGFKPLIKKVERNKMIHSKYCVVQDRKTGKIDVWGDYRCDRPSPDDPDYELVIDWTFYYPHSFKSPFAAYLIPPDIKVGEEVFIEDLIEDIVGKSWNQGDVYRLESCTAIWNGKDLDIRYDIKKDMEYVIG